MKTCKSRTKKEWRSFETADYDNLIKKLQHCISCFCCIKIFCKQSVILLSCITHRQTYLKDQVEKSVMSHTLYAGKKVLMYFITEINTYFSKNNNEVGALKCNKFNSAFIVSSILCTKFYHLASKVTCRMEVFYTTCSRSSTLHALVSWGKYYSAINSSRAATV